MSLSFDPDTDIVGILSNLSKVILLPFVMVTIVGMIGEQTVLRCLRIFIWQICRQETL